MNQLNWYPFENHFIKLCAPDQGAGVYYLARRSVLGEKLIVYVGQSSNSVQARLRAHVGIYEADDFAYQSCSSPHDAALLEAFVIAQLKPFYNEQGKSRHAVSALAEALGATKNK